MAEQENVCAGNKESCPVIMQIGLCIHNKAVITEAERSELNRHVVRVEKSLPDEALQTRQGKSLLVKNHVLHGGVGPFCKRAIEYLRLRGIEIEPQMVPQEIENS